MKIGLVTDGLADMPLETLLPAVARLGITMVEFGCGNWSPAPHLDLDRLLASQAARADFLALLSAHGLSVSALNCSGNPLLPGSAGEAHRAITSKTVALAGLRGGPAGSGIRRCFVHRARGCGAAAIGRGEGVGRPVARRVLSDGCWA